MGRWSAGRCYCRRGLSARTGSHLLQDFEEVIIYLKVRGAFRQGLSFVALIYQA